MEVLPHHIKPDVCLNRPKYREGKVPKAVKVYTCAQESKYLLVTKIPSVGAHNELIKLFGIYGEIQEHKMLDEYPTDEFCETILLKFLKIQHARTAKIKLDNYNFYGGCLHVCYAPEFESIVDVKEKLNERKYIISVKCKKYDLLNFGTQEYELNQTILKKNKTKLIKKEEKIDEKQAPLVLNPQLPLNWMKQTLTGDSSYDQTVKEIRSKLEKTIPHQQLITTYPKKRKKILQL